MISKSSGYLSIGSANCKISIDVEIITPRIDIFKIEYLEDIFGTINPNGKSKNKLIITLKREKLAIVRGLWESVTINEKKILFSVNFTEEKTPSIRTKM